MEIAWGNIIASVTQWKEKAHVFIVVRRKAEVSVKKESLDNVLKY